MSVPVGHAGLGARDLLFTLPAQVAGQRSSGAYTWVHERDHTAADTARDQILQALIDLQKRGAPNGGR